MSRHKDAYNRTSKLAGLCRKGFEKGYKWIRGHDDDLSLLAEQIFVIRARIEDITDRIEQLEGDNR